MAKKKRLKIALIGYGAISQTLFDVFADKKPAIDVVGILVRPGRAKETQKKVGRKVAVVASLKGVLKLNPPPLARAGSPRAGGAWGGTILHKCLTPPGLATRAPTRP